MPGVSARFPGTEGRTYLNSCSFGLPPHTVDAVYARWQRAMHRFEDDAFRPDRVLGGLFHPLAVATATPSPTSPPSASWS